MALKLSTGLVNKMLTTAPLRNIMSNCVIDIYSGAQVADADTAVAGTLLVTLSKSSGAFTGETKAVGALTIAGAAGSVDTVTVNAVDILGGSVAFVTDINATATAVANAINANPKNTMFDASTTGASGVITLTAREGLGTLVNTWAVSGTYTTITGGTYVALTGGVDAVNGCKWGTAAAGVLSKDAVEVWSGNAVATGTAGWFRIRGSNDAGGASTTLPRVDGAVATSGAQMNLGSLTITSGAPFVVPTGTLTLPKA